MKNLLASALRGDGASLQSIEGPNDHAVFLELATQQGVDCLIRRKQMEQGVWRSAPPVLKQALDRRAKDEATLEVLRRREIAWVVAGLKGAGAPALVLKGAGLAYTHYPAPYLRPCRDTDILVRKGDAAKAAEQLDALGYQRLSSVSRDVVHAQLTFRKLVSAAEQIIDLHWAISNRPLFASMLTFDELMPCATPVAALGEGALTPGAVDALLLACIHRVAHHGDSDRLIWLYDIKLLAESLSRVERDRFWRVAARKQLVTLCAESVALAARQVGCSAEMREGIVLPHPESLGDEPSAAYLGERATGRRSLFLDLKAARGATGKIRLLAGHAFPTAAYMRDAFGATGPMALTVAYARRAGLGMWRIMTSSPEYRPRARPPF